MVGAACIAGVQGCRIGGLFCSFIQARGWLGHVVGEWLSEGAYIVWCWHPLGTAWVSFALWKWFAPETEGEVL
jgi:hypothetical protein